MEVAAVETGPICAKLPSDQHHWNTNIRAGCPSCHPTNGVKAWKSMFTHTGTGNNNNKNFLTMAYLINLINNIMQQLSLLRFQKKVRHNTGTLLELRFFNLILRKGLPSADPR